MLLIRDKLHFTLQTSETLFFLSCVSRVMNKFSRIMNIKGMLKISFWLSNLLWHEAKALLQEHKLTLTRNFRDDSHYKLRLLSSASFTLRRRSLKLLQLSKSFNWNRRDVVTGTRRQKRSVWQFLAKLLPKAVTSSEFLLFKSPAQVALFDEFV